MSVFELRIELPAHSRSFQINVQSHWSIREIKEEIRRTCPGGPQVEGQRVIWRGRILNDEERVSEVWKSPSDTRVVHLAVHPSAWSTSPSIPAPSPSSMAETQVPATSQPTPTRTIPRAQYGSPPPLVPLSFIVQKHNDALYVLTHGELPQPPTNPATLREARVFAVGALYAHGWSWPAILDEEYPLSTGSSEGVKYERITRNNQSFLRLVTPNATPTPIQQHALKVLPQTFPLLSITTPDPATHQPSPHSIALGITPTANLNQYLQQVGIPPMRLAPGQPNHNPNDPNNAVAEIRAIPLRALLMPLIMLTFRTFVLVYFFSPSKRPFFGLILSVWILWETWGALRRVLGNDRLPAVPGQPGQARGDPAGGADQGANQRGQAAGVGPTQGDNHSHFDVLINHMANMGLASQEAVLDSALPVAEPSILRKTRDFAALLLTTLHPAVWDRRRSALRRREGRVGGEKRTRPPHPHPPAETDGDEDATRVQARTQAVAKHERRQPWVKQYVERVQTTEWAEDM